MSDDKNYVPRMKFIIEQKGNETKKTKFKKGNLHLHYLRYEKKRKITIYFLNYDILLIYVLDIVFHPRMFGRGHRRTHKKG